MDISEYKLIFSPQLAKYLLSKGFFIVDLKQKKENELETIFVFKKDVNLLDAINIWKLSNKKCS